MEEHETPMMEDPYSGSSHSYVEREKTKKFSDFLASEEPIELVERSLYETPTKRRPAWCQDIL